jgi:hypothetical protein
MLNKIFIKSIVLFLFVALTFDIFAGGGKRNGTAGAQELLIPVSARGLALSGAYTAGIEGIDAMFYNPAGVGASSNSVDAMFSYMNYIADIGNSFAAVAVNFEGFGSLGLSFRTLDFGDIPVTTESDPYGTGATFSPTFVIAGFTYANAITDRIRVGVNINMISEQIMSTSATGFAFDAGVQYKNMANIDGLMFGIALKNLGAKMRYDGANLLRKATEDQDVTPRGLQFYKISAAEFELPSQLEIGLAYETKFADALKGILATSFQNNNFSHDEYKIAGELSYDDFLFVRAGYTQVNENTDNTDEYLYGPTFGVGLKVYSGVNITVDYAYRAADYFDANHMFSVKLGF